MSDFLVDTHCHLNHRDFARDLQAVVSRALDAGVERMVCVGYDWESSASAVDVARKFDVVRAAVGVHPHDARTFTSEVEERLKSLASDDRVVAIGETGLDYYRDLSPRDIQQNAFRRHIRMASELDLPLIVHSRDAQDDVIAILRDEGLPPRGVVMHCLPSDADFARKSLEMGCYLGIAGPVTYRNAESLRKIVEGLPLDSLLVETDCPYLTPHPHRGKRNEPSYLPIIARELARIHGVRPSEIASITTSNAVGVFGHI